jgi:L-amino acid N-acyltransferase YncA
MVAPEHSTRIAIRRVEPGDLEALQTIFNEIVKEGTAFLTTEAVSLQAIRHMWLSGQTEAYVAYDQVSGETIGAYLLKPNAHGRGAHIANATYMVKARHRGRDVGQRLGEHSLKRARETGYLAMQFNAVVSSNTRSVKLWQRLGFSIIGTVPNGFRMPSGEYVDTYIMYRRL